MGMILIDENLRIVSDADTWIIQENKPVQDEASKNFGKDAWQNRGYYTRLNLAFEKIYDMKLKNIPYTELKEFLEEAKRIKAELNKKFDIKAL